MTEQTQTDTTATTATVDQAQQTQQTQQAGARPDYIPEKFWDAEAKAPRIEDLAKSYATLEAGRGKLKETLTAEINAERFKARPEKPEGYKLGVPETLKNVVVLDKEPGADFAPEPGKTYFLAKADSPLMKSATALAHKYGVPQAEFSELVGALATELGQRAPTTEEIAAQRTEALKPLGEHGEKRIEHVDNQLAALIGGDKAKALRDAPGTAAGIEAMEALLEKMGQAKFSPGVTGGEPALTETELRAIVASDEYQREASADGPLHKKVREGYLRLNPPGSGPSDRVFNRGGIPTR